MTRDSRLRTLLAWLSPEVVPEERKHPGGGGGDAGGAALPVFHPVGVCLGPALRPQRSLAAHHYRGGQHRHAALRHRCGESELRVRVYMYVSTQAGMSPPICTSRCSFPMFPRALSKQRGNRTAPHCSLALAILSLCVRLTHVDGRVHVCSLNQADEAAIWSAPHQ